MMQQFSIQPRQPNKIAADTLIFNTIGADSEISEAASQNLTLSLHYLYVIFVINSVAQLYSLIFFW